MLQVREGTRGVPADLLICTVRKAEVLTILVSEAQLHGRQLPLTFSDSLCYRSKKGGGFFVSGTEVPPRHHNRTAACPQLLPLYCCLWRLPFG